MAEQMADTGAVVTTMTEEEYKSKQDDVQTPDSESLTDEELISQIKSKESQLKEQESEEVLLSTPEIVTKPEEPDVPVKAVQPKFEPHKPDYVSVNETDRLMKKKGFKSVDDLAKSYTELERNFHRQRQEESTTRRTHSQGVDETERMKEAWLEDFQRDPLGTISQTVSILNEPLIQEQKQGKLHSEVTKLAMEYPDFAEETVQSEIAKVFTENPEWQSNPSGNLKNAFFVARGRLVKPYLNSTQPNITDKRRASVENTSRQERVSNTVNPYEMPMDELEKTVKSLMKG